MSVYYVDSAWTGTASGTFDEPFNTWAAAESAWSAGDVLLVKAGSDFADVADIVVPGAGCTLGTYGDGAAPILRNESARLMTLANDDNLTVFGLDLRHNGTGDAILVSHSAGNGSDGFTIRDCLLTVAGDSDGISGVQTDNGTVDACTISNQGDGSAVKVNDSHGWTIQNSTMTSTGAEGDTSGIDVIDSGTATIQGNTISAYSNGVRISASSGAANANVVQNNTVAGQGNVEGGGNGIKILESTGQSVSGTIIRNNIVTQVTTCIVDNADTGAAGTEVYGNIMYDFRTNGVDIRADRAGTNLVYNNTVDHASHDTGGHAIVMQTGTSITAEVKNNIIIERYHPSGTQNINGMMIASSTLADLDIDYNVYVFLPDSSTPETPILFGFDGADYFSQDIVAWRSLLAATANIDGHDENSVVLTTDPFVDSANNDYALASGASIIGMGPGVWAAANADGTHQGSASGEPWPAYAEDPGAMQSTHHVMHPAQL